MQSGSLKRPLWPLLTAALVGLPVLYVASWGPAVWIYVYGSDRGWRISGSLQIILDWVYYPLVWLILNGPKPISDALTWYAKLFAS